MNTFESFLPIGITPSKQAHINGLLNQLQENTNSIRNVSFKTKSGGLYSVPIGDNWTPIPGYPDSKHRVLYEDENIMLIQADTVDLKMNAHLHEGYHYETVIVAKGSVTYITYGVAIQLGAGGVHKIDADEEHALASDGEFYLIFNKRR